MRSLPGLLLVFVLSVRSYAQDLTFDPYSQCLNQDTDGCIADDWLGEFECLRGFKSLREVLNCVKQDESGSVKDPICKSSKVPSTFDVNSYKWIDSKGVYCTSPRTLIVETWKQLLTKRQKRDSPILGQLRACPLDDPNYHNCLCWYGVLPQHLQILVPRFRVYYQTDLSSGLACSKSYPKPISEEVARSLPVEKRQNKVWAPACKGCDFDISPEGLPVYKDEEGIYTGLYPLPTHDTLVRDGRALRRCYVHPTEPVEVSCTAWWLRVPQTVTSTAPISTPKATFSSYYSDDESLAPASTTPPSASLPITSMSYSGSIGTDPVTMTSVAGTAASTTLASSSAIAEVPTLVVELFTLFIVIYSLVL